MDVKDIEEMKIPRGQTIDVIAEREAFGHLGSGSIPYSTTGHYARIELNETEKEKKPELVLYPRMMLHNENFEGEPIPVLIEEIIRIEYI